MIRASKNGRRPRSALRRRAGPPGSRRLPRSWRRPRPGFRAPDPHQLRRAPGARRRSRLGVDDRLVAAPVVRPHAALAISAVSAGASCSARTAGARPPARSPRRRRGDRRSSWSRWNGRRWATVDHRGGRCTRAFSRRRETDLDPKRRCVGEGPVRQEPELLLGAAERLTAEQGAHPLVAERGETLVQVDRPRALATWCPRTSATG